MLLVFTDAAPAFRVGGLVCASYPSDTVYPKTHNASAPKKTHASRLPIETTSYQLTLKAHCVITHSLKCSPPILLLLLPTFTHMPCGLSWAIIGMFGMHSPSLAYRLFPTQFPMDVFVVPWKEDGQDIRDFFSPGRSLVSTASERSMCRW